MEKHSYLRSIKNIYKERERERALLPEKCKASSRLELSLFSRGLEEEGYLIFFKINAQSNTYKKMINNNTLETMNNEHFTN